MLSKIVELFSKDQQFMESTGCSIIKQLCEIIEPEKLFTSFADILVCEQDFKFAGNS